MRPRPVYIAILLISLAGCTNKKNPTDKYTQINSPEYNQRYKKAGISSQRIYAIVESNSEINPIDSVLLMSAVYKNGYEKQRTCFSYSSTLPDYLEHPYSSIESHNVFDIPFDYKSLCFVSRYNYDTLGRLIFQNDSIDWKRVREYEKRSGRLNSDIEYLSKNKNILTSIKLKFFDSKGKDSAIMERDQHLDTWYVTYKSFEWPDNSIYKIKTLFLSKFSTEEEIKKIKTLNWELLEVGLRESGSHLEYSEKYITPTHLADITYGGYSKTPTTVISKFLIGPKVYAKVKKDILYKDFSYYDSSIFEFDKNDSLLSEVKYSGGIKAINEIPIHVSLEKEIKYKRNAQGLLISIKEDNYLFNISEITKCKYDRKADKLIAQEQIKEIFDEKGEMIRTESFLYKYDSFGNLLEEKMSTFSPDENEVKRSSTSRKVYNYDSMGNRIGEKEFANNVLVINKEWKFNKNGLITEYHISDKLKGMNHKLVWIYKYVKN